MKIRPPSSKHSRASTLMAVFLLVVIVAGMLASYLVLVQNEYKQVARSQAWNKSLMAAEAGVEEAMALVNKYEGTRTSLSNWVNTAVSQDHWTSLTSTNGKQQFRMTRDLPGDGSYTVYITCNISNLTTGPINVPTILSIGTVPNLSGKPAVRKIFVQTKPDSNIAGGLIAETAMNFNGNNTLVDSFDSSSPLHSLWQTTWTYNGSYYGVYNSAYRTAEAVVGTDGNIVDVGNANIYGFVDTGPGGGVSIQKNGSVGDLTWVPTPGIQTSPTNHLRDDMNVIFDDVVLPAGTNSYYPSTAWALSPTYYPSPGTNINSVTYNYVINNIAGQPGTPTNKIYYAVSTAVLNNIYINASNVVLYLPNGVNMGPHDYITLTPNSSVDIYTGSDFSTGNGTVNNMTQYAPPFKIYGLPTCTSISFGGNATLTAWIYAPEATVSFNGGGNSSSYDVVGSFMVHDVSVNGHYNFHFDVSCKWILPPFRFVPISWQELVGS